MTGATVIPITRRPMPLPVP